jgi:hypothetical protein
MAESIKRKFSSLANQQPGTGDPRLPPMVAMAEQIREAINVKAGVTDAEVSDFFDDLEGTVGDQTDAIMQNDDFVVAEEQGGPKPTLDSDNN